jgi:UDP-2,3-diacylglucosamine hydrolase
VNRNRAAPQDGSAAHHAMKATLFLSDLHLAPRERDSAAAFHRFASGAAREAAAVYVLGDLFDWWVGDDQLRSRFHAKVAAALRALADAGVQVHVARGNRDFLLGEDFARAAGAALLGEHTVVELAGVPTLLTHGDELCTDDEAYQRFRAKTRTDAWRRDILRKPYLVRRAIAAALRLGSRRATARKDAAIMDVNAAAVADAFRVHGVTRIIHGHTHRPARHALVVDGVARERHVLAAWHGEGRYLAVDDRGVREHSVNVDAA